MGPEAIDALLELAMPGAWLALSINSAHFEAAGFAAHLDALAARIGDLALPEVPIYGPRARGPHRNDTALIALFRRTGRGAGP